MTMTSVQAIKAARLLEAVDTAYQKAFGPESFMEALHDEGFHIVAIPPPFTGRPPEPVTAGPVPMQQPIVLDENGRTECTKCLMRMKAGETCDRFEKDCPLAGLVTNMPF